MHSSFCFVLRINQREKNFGCFRRCSLTPRASTTSSGCDNQMRRYSVLLSNIRILGNFSNDIKSGQSGIRQTRRSLSRETRIGKQGVRPKTRSNWPICELSHRNLSSFASCQCTLYIESLQIIQI